MMAPATELPESERMPEKPLSNMHSTLRQHTQHGSLVSPRYSGRWRGTRSLTFCSFQGWRGGARQASLNLIPYTLGESTRDGRRTCSTCAPYGNCELCAKAVKLPLLRGSRMRSVYARVSQPSCLCTQHTTRGRVASTLHPVTPAPGPLTRCSQPHPSRRPLSLPC